MSQIFRELKRKSQCSSPNRNMIKTCAQMEINRSLQQCLFVSIVAERRSASCFFKAKFYDILKPLWWLIIEDQLSKYKHDKIKYENFCLTIGDCFLYFQIDGFHFWKKKDAGADVKGESEAPQSSHERPWQRKIETGATGEENHCWH